MTDTAWLTALRVFSYHLSLTNILRNQLSRLPMATFPQRLLCCMPQMECFHLKLSYWVKYVVLRYFSLQTIPQSETFQTKKPTETG